MAETLTKAGLNPAELGKLSPDEDADTLPKLIAHPGARRCSVCKMLFPPDSQPSVDDAFAEHVRTAHGDCK